MADLLLHGLPVPSIFSLLGTNENDITYSLGLVLSRSPTLGRLLLRQVLPAGVERAVEAVYLQRAGADGGFTDIEIIGDDLHLIIEAKRGWDPPETAQLERYTPRFRDGARHCAFLAIAGATPEYATATSRLAAEVGGVPVHYLSWREIAELVGRAGAEARGINERHLLRELAIYFRNIVTMQPQTSNLAYVVVLSPGRIEPATLAWREVVDPLSLYFHPYGDVGRRGGWPQEPPNYLAFRYDGQLQSIHHVEDWKVVDDLSPFIPELESVSWNREYPHALYTLGPAIRPQHPVRNGRIYPNGRYWVMVDLLLTSPTIADAVRETKRRMGEL